MFDNSDAVPQVVKGARIWYSPSLQKFAIVDPNNPSNTLKYFGMDKYRDFQNAGIIEFNSGSQDYIESEYDDWYDEQQQSINDEIAAEQRIREATTETPGDSMYQEQQDEKQKKAKDPTRHITGFFVTVAIVAVIAIIVRLVIIPMLLNMQAIA